MGLIVKPHEHNGEVGPDGTQFHTPAQAGNNYMYCLTINCLAEMSSMSLAM